MNSNNKKQIRALSIFILFLLAEYIPTTFIESFKYYEAGMFTMFLPLIIATLAGTFIYRKAVANEHFGRTYFKLVGISTCGLLTAKAILYIQWYWLIAPEYRNVPNDMAQGLAWAAFDLMIRVILVSFSYIVQALTIKAVTSLSRSS